ncbi:unnamed protein product [Tetraodon nigroviridis]|uniref:(spotted green pufferfish) hypothetical protein n=1 Tax=Tetraodon nigroviridis TaxID=99883 RepID=Q4SC18_TETNG|nr:unnamed protein product [Tetraodon nigroviridis]
MEDEAFSEHSWETYNSGLSEPLRLLPGVYRKLSQDVYRKGAGVHLLCLASGIRGVLGHREHSCPVQRYPHHSGQHDASHPLCEGGPRVPAGHRLLGHPGVLQLRLRPGNHHLHRDEQDQGYCHQRSHSHATDHLLPVCADKGPLRPGCSVQRRTFVSEFQAKAGLFGEGLQKLPGDSFKELKQSSGLLTL